MPGGQSHVLLGQCFPRLQLETGGSQNLQQQYSDGVVPRAKRLKKKRPPRPHIRATHPHLCGPGGHRLKTSDPTSETKVPILSQLMSPHTCTAQPVSVSGLIWVLTYSRGLAAPWQQADLILLSSRIQIEDHHRHCSRLVQRYIRPRCARKQAKCFRKSVDHAPSSHVKFHLRVEGPGRLGPDR